MEQTVINATTEFLQGQIAQFEEIIKSKDEHIQRITQRDYATKAELCLIRDNMHDWTITALQNERISEEWQKRFQRFVALNLPRKLKLK
jgi:hypothetical protein